MVRIVGGARRGLVLAAPAGRTTRPTADRLRETMFQLLDNRRALAGRAALDLYAGSGALGLEALSRGAASCDFVEVDRTALAVLRRNVARLGLPGAQVVAGDAERFLAGTPTAAGRYGVLLVDPPYDLWPRLAAPGALGDRLARVATPGAVLAAEHPARGRARGQHPDLGRRWTAETTRGGGASAVTVYMLADPADGLPA